MPAVRERASKTAAVKPESTRTKKARKTSPAKAAPPAADTTQQSNLSTLVPVLRASLAWGEIISLVTAKPPTAEFDDTTKAAFCRAVYHVVDADESSTAKAKSWAAEMLARDPSNVDALIYTASLASRAGDHNLAADKALEALKASEYKDQDAISLLQESQIKGHQSKSHEAVDPYAVLHVSKTAPLAVIQAARAALTHPEGSTEALQADEALRILSDQTLRKSLDEASARRKSAGFGTDFSGGSEVLQQLIQILGIRIPDGFTLPANGRFQGGFGGGFEFTWGDSVKGPDHTRAVEGTQEGEEGKPSGVVEASAGLPTPPS